jgi:hypothetical protein
LFQRGSKARNPKDRNKYEEPLARLSKEMAYRKRGASRRKAFLFKTMQEVLDKWRSVKTQTLFYTRSWSMF